MSDTATTTEPKLTIDQKIEKARKDFAVNVALSLLFVMFAFLLSVAFWQTLTSQVNSWDRVFDALFVVAVVIFAATKLYAAAQERLIHRELLAEKYVSK